MNFAWWVALKTNRVVEHESTAAFKSHPDISTLENARMQIGACMMAQQHSHRDLDGGRERHYDIKESDEG